jgi:squalene-hopene/tetraprenyl-beta-curcumene cyclase
MFTRYHYLAVLLFVAAPAFAEEKPSTPATAPAGAQRPISREELRAKVAPAIARALKYQVDHQKSDGGWPFFVLLGGSDPAITSLVAQSLIQDPNYGPEHPAVKKAIDFILKHQQPDGGIYNPKMPYLNYSTSVALMALASAQSPALKERIAAAQKCLKDNQWVDGKCDADGTDITPSHPWYGGAGYGNHKRPDLSNTQMMLEALHQSGLPADDPAFVKAMSFVQRCQMQAMTNDQPFAEGATDGGFIYTPAKGGHSNAGEKDGKLRSYGSMTYSGFKSMLYANVSRNDPRVRGAWDWIRRNYTLDENPNMPGLKSKEGLYYYYQVFAKALQAWGEPFVIDEAGAAHDWRADLANELLERQHSDGRWENSADRWMEGNPYLVTAYSVLALQAALR